MTYTTPQDLSYNKKFLPFDHLHPLHPPSHLPLPATANLFSVYKFFFLIPQMSEIIQYLSFSI